MACGTTKQSQRTFHPHFLTCLGPTFCSINSGKVIVRFLWHWHKKDTGHSCLHHHFIFPKISPISRFSHLENFENSPIIFPYLMAILFMPFFFFDRMGGCFGSLCLNLWWDEGGVFSVGFRPVKWGHISCWWCFTNSTMVIVDHHQTTIWDNYFPCSTHLNANRLIFLSISDVQDTCIIWRLHFHFAVDNLFVIHCYSVEGRIQCITISSNIKDVHISSCAFFFVERHGPRTTQKLNIMMMSYGFRWKSKMTRNTYLHVAVVNSDELLYCSIIYTDAPFNDLIHSQHIAVWWFVWV